MEQVLKKLEALAEALVLAEPGDAEAVAEIAAGLREWADLADQVGAPAPCAERSRLMSDYLRQSPEKAWALLERLVAALQAVVRDRRNPAEIQFPEIPAVMAPPADVDESAADENGAATQQFEKEAMAMHAQADQKTGSEQAKALGGKYLTFKLAGEEYGIEILKVQEIIKMMTITKVPRMPPFVCGVINLRGKVIPIMDLRLKFEMPAAEVTDLTCVVVVQVAQAQGKVVMGLIVDEVSEVLDVAENQIEPPPEFGAAVDTAFILGMAKFDAKVVILLDVDRVLSASEVSSLQRAASA